MGKGINSKYQELLSDYEALDTKMDDTVRELNMEIEDKDDMIKSQASKIAVMNAELPILRRDLLAYRTDRARLLHRITALKEEVTKHESDLRLYENLAKLCGTLFVASTLVFIAVNIS